MRKNIFLLSIFIFLFCLSATAGICYAFFDGNFPIKTEEFSPVTGQDSNLIDSENDLRILSKYQDNNTNIAVSETRQMIELNNNITLTDNITFTADFNLDLNGHTLDLNGNEMLIKHSFYGSTVITNGDIIDSIGNGSVIFDTQNSVSIVSANAPSGTVIYQSFDETALSQEIFNEVDKKLYSDLTAGYFTDDVILINNYYGYDIDFEYTSSHPAILNNKGKLLDNTITQNIDITLDLTINSNVYQNSYAVSIVADSDTNTILSIGEEYLQEKLNDYYNIETGRYILHNDLMLPDKYSYFELTFNYKSLDNFVDRNEISGDLLSNILLINNEARTLYLETTVQYQSSTYIFDIEIDIVYENKYETANNIVDELSPIVIVDEQTVIPLIDWQDYSETGLNDMVYTLIGNEDNYYYIENNSLKVNTLPTDLDMVVLQIDFYFTGNTEITRYVSVNLQSSDGTGAGVDRFYDYYLYLDTLLHDRTQMSYTYNSFVMPANYTLWDGTTINFEYVPSLSGSDILTLTSDSEFYYFDIDTNNIPYEDTLVTVEYTDPFSDEIYSLSSSFTIPGIVRQGSGANDIYDQNLYNEIKSVYGNDDEPYLLSSQLARAVDLFQVDSTINDFKGIETLVNTYAFDFSSIGFDNDDLLYLDGLNNLRSLNLSDNNINSLDNLNNLENLEYIDLSDNSIDWFDPLLNFTNLTEAVIYNNNETSSDYGSKGNYNSNVFIQLTLNEIDLYNDYDAINSEKILYTYNSDMLTSSRVLEGIIYQDVATSLSDISRPSSVENYTIQYTDISSSRYVASVTVNGYTVYKIFDVTIE